MNPLFRAVSIGMMMVVFHVAGVNAQEPQKKDPCSLLSKAEIQAEVKQTVGDGHVKSGANPAVGAPCQYKIGGYGVFSILLKSAGPGETADTVKAELNKRKVPISDLPGLGEHSFFSSPGYGMIQLNTFKGSDYLIITMMLPGANEKAQKTAAQNLMRKALANL